MSTFGAGFSDSVAQKSHFTAKKPRSEITLSYWITQIMTSFKYEDINCKRGDKLQYVNYCYITSCLVIQLRH